VEESRTPILGSCSKLNTTTFANRLLMDITAMVNFLLQSLIVPTFGIYCQLQLWLFADSRFSYYLELIWLTMLLLIRPADLLLLPICGLAQRLIS
jgi:hypothetical protein